MATPIEVARAYARRAGIWGVRCFLALASLGSVAWGVFCLPVFLDQSRLEGTRDLILRDVPLSDAVLEQLNPLLERSASRSYCIPSYDRSAAIIRLRLLDNAFAAGRGDLVNVRMGDLDAAIGKSLGCAPADPYLWLVLFWLRDNRSGPSKENFDLLRLSYRLGPNEGWIASKRNYLALAMFDALPADLVTEAIAEFSRLVRTELYTEAIEILKGPGWPHRDRLLAGLSTVPDRNKTILTKAMFDLGYDIGKALPAEGRSPDRR